MIMSSKKIFLCYRRANSAWPHLIRERLTREFGTDAVFMDQFGIRSGENFEERLQQEVSFCSAMVVVIGEDWLSEIDPRSGDAKIRNPLDFFHIEILTALIKNIPIFPTLIDGAKCRMILIFPLSFGGFLRRRQ